jgi:DNA-binding HxlR family transcriptional regulator
MKTSILLHLKDRTLRFSELQRAMAVSQKVLTQQLKKLERGGLVQWFASQGSVVALMCYHTD